MRVLHLFDGWRPPGPNRIEFGFVSKLSRFCDFVVYGPNEHKIDRKFAPVKYEGKITAKDLVSIFKPDIILCHMHEKTAYWLPKDFNTISVPKVMLEIDYWSNENKEWYEKCGFDLLIQRGYYKESIIPSVWLPFSVNEEELVFSNKMRENRLVFVGSISCNPHYKIRKQAISILSKAKLLSNLGKVFDSEYFKVLSETTCALSCSAGSFHSPIAKIFEIMGSGAALLCTWFHGKSELFGDEKVFFQYEDDCSNIKDVAKQMLEDTDTTEYVAKTAQKIILQKHLDKYRIAELYQILHNVLSGNEIIKKWGN